MDTHGPSVSLQAVLPSREVICIEAGATEGMRDVKDRIATLAGISLEIFALTFDGYEVGDKHDGRNVGDLPFEDESELQVELDKAVGAKMKLDEIGCSSFSTLVSRFKAGKFFTNNEIGNASLCDILDLFIDAGLCDNPERTARFIYEIIISEIRYTYLTSVDLLLSRTSASVHTGLWIYRNETTLLHEAVCATRYFAVILQHARDVNAANGDGCTALHRACKESNLNAATLLLQHGADVNVRNVRKETPLHTAANFDHTGCFVSLLLKHGADVTATNSNGDTPLHLAFRCKDGHYVAELLVRSDHGKTILKYRNPKGSSPLHVAATSGATTTGLMREMIKLGSDIHEEDTNGMTPFQCLFLKDTSINWQKLEAMGRLLLGEDLDVNLKCKNGKTPLHYAICDGCLPRSAIQFLLGLGANIEARDNDGWTPLHYGARWGFLNRCTILLEHKADPNARSEDGDTPSSLALQYRHRDLLPVLQEHGAELRF